MMMLFQASIFPKIIKAHEASWTSLTNLSCIPKIIFVCDQWKVDKQNNGYKIDQAVVAALQATMEKLEMKFLCKSTRYSMVLVPLDDYIRWL